MGSVPSSPPSRLAFKVASVVKRKDMYSMVDKKMTVIFLRQY